MFSRKSSISSKSPKIQSPRSKSQKKSMFSRLTSRFQTRKSRSPSIRESSIQLEPVINKEEIQKEIDNHKTKIEELKKIIDNTINPEMTKLKEEFDIIAFKYQELYKEWKIYFSNNNRNASEDIWKKMRHNSSLRAEIVDKWENLYNEKKDKNKEINSLDIEIEMLNKQLKDNKSGGTRKRRKYKKHKKHKKHKKTLNKKY
jgi:hypothetical protein